jgi:hypothetical protein
VPFPLLDVFRTSANTAMPATTGAALAPSKIGAKEYLSVIVPMAYVAAIVTKPVTMPEKPLTVATDPLSNRSDGKVRKIVAQAA